VFALMALSFAAGVLTVAAPCVLPLLPVIVGGSIVRGADGADPESRSRWMRPVTIAASLAVSVIIFTVLLKASTVALGVPKEVWQVIAGGIVIAFGINLVFPSLWEKFMAVTGLTNRSNEALNRAHGKGTVAGDIALGAALGPVFSSCSPTYGLILATILPASFAEGLLYIAIYALGLAVTLLLIAFLGQAVVQKLGWLARPDGIFRRVIGVIFIVVGIVVILGIDKEIQTFILDQGWYDPIAAVEELLRPR
jgi:cytochrome c-type biogenesis protein